MFTSALVSRSIYQKLNLIFSKEIDNSKPLKVMLLFQILLASLLPVISYNTISYLDDIREILKEFVGLIALIEIDNWAGMIFELYLDTFHNGLT